KGDSFGVLNNGTFITAPGVDKIWDFTEESLLTYARSDGKIGFINGKGEWVIQPAYDKARAFTYGLAPVYEDKKWGYINEKGEKIVDFIYRDAETFSENGLAPVKEKKLWGFIDTSGKVVIPMEYDIISGNIPNRYIRGLSNLFNIFEGKGFYSGLARVKKDKQWGFINEKGQIVGKWHQNAEAFE